MLPEKNVRALKIISEIFFNNAITWRLIGSTNLFLQGVPIKPNDLDIVIPSSVSEKVQKLLSEYTISSLEYSESVQFRSHFGRYYIEGCEVEIMGDLEIKKGGNWLKTAPAEDFSVQILLDLGTIKIPGTKLGIEYETYLKMERIEKAQSIKQTLEGLKETVSKYENS